MTLHSLTSWAYTMCLHSVSLGHEAALLTAEQHVPDTSSCLRQTLIAGALSDLMCSPQHPAKGGHFMGTHSIEVDGLCQQIALR